MRDCLPTIEESDRDNIFGVKMVYGDGAEDILVSPQLDKLSAIEFAREVNRDTDESYCFATFFSSFETEEE